MGDVLKVAILLMMSACFLYARDYLKTRSLYKGEFYVLGLFATLGMLVMVSAGSLLTVYLGLELLSLCLYALVAYDRDSTTSSEAAMKYFVLGALASGILLYGISLVYGFSGSTSYEVVAETEASLGFMFGMVLMITGLAFKIV